jgi:Xaa-Pro dipeptidase
VKFYFLLSPHLTFLLQASFDILRPGFHWDAVQLLRHHTLVKGFQRLGIFKSPNTPGSVSWNSEEAILSSGVSAASFPHGAGHSLGMDVHDVPSASKPAVNHTIKTAAGHPSFYDFLRLRLPLEAGMVVVRYSFLPPSIIRCY